MEKFCFDFSENLLILHFWRLSWHVFSSKLPIYCSDYSYVEVSWQFSCSFEDIVYCLRFSCLWFLVNSWMIFLFSFHFVFFLVAGRCCKNRWPWSGLPWLLDSGAVVFLFCVCSASVLAGILPSGGLSWKVWVSKALPSWQALNFIALRLSGLCSALSFPVVVFCLFSLILLCLCACV